MFEILLYTLGWFWYLDDFSQEPGSLRKIPQYQGHPKV